MDAYVKIQYLAQRHFIQAGGAGDQTTHLLIGRLPSQPPEPQPPSQAVVAELKYVQ